MLLFANIKITLHLFTFYFVLLWRMNVFPFVIWHITTTMLFDINIILINIILIFHYLIWLGVSAYMSAQLKEFIETKTESLKKTKLLNWKWQEQATSSEELRIWRWQLHKLRIKNIYIVFSSGLLFSYMYWISFQTAIFAKYLLSTGVLNSCL